jgi:glucokinase
LDKRFAIGVDIGGTKIALTLINRQGDVLVHDRLPTEPEGGVESIVGRIAGSIRHLQAQVNEPISGVGIGCPGIIDSAQGVVRYAVNLHWTDVPLVSAIQERCGLSTWILNDVKAITLAEVYYGAAQNCRDVVYIAVGTGLGACAIVNGNIVEGAAFCAMELGHMALEPHGRLCNCGLRGCAEMYISGNGLLSGLQEHIPNYPKSVLGDNATTAEIIEAARAGDVLALTIIAEARDWLGRVIRVCASVLNPALVIIGGGLGTAASDLLLTAELVNSVKSGTLPFLHENLQIVPAQINDSAIGAACQVWLKT